MAKKGAECAFPYINILDESAFAQVRDGVYTVLQNTGVTVQSRKMRKILKDYGCRVDEERERVYFDRDVILRALEASPKGFEIKARDEKNHVLLQPEKPLSLSTPAAQAFITVIPGNRKRRRGKNSTNI